MIDTKTATESPAGRKRNRWLPWAIVLGLITAVAIGGLFWFYVGDAPAEVDLAETVSAVEETAAVQTSDGIEGGWSVDTNVGEFTVTEETTATFAEIGRASCRVRVYI